MSDVSAAKIADLQACIKRLELESTEKEELLDKAMAQLRIFGVKLDKQGQLLEEDNSIRDRIGQLGKELKDEKANGRFRLEQVVSDKKGRVYTHQGGKELTTVWKSSSDRCKYRSIRPRQD